MKFWIRVIRLETISTEVSAVKLCVGLSGPSLFLNSEWVSCSHLIASVYLSSLLEVTSCRNLLLDDSFCGENNFQLNNNELFVFSLALFSQGDKSANTTAVHTLRFPVSTYSFRKLGIIYVFGRICQRNCFSDQVYWQVSVIAAAMAESCVVSVHPSLRM